MYASALTEHLCSSRAIAKPQHGPVSVRRWSGPFVQGDVEGVELPAEEEGDGPRSAQEQVYSRALDAEAELANMRRDRRNERSCLGGIERSWRARPEVSPRGKMWSFIEKGGVCGEAWLRDEVDEADDLRPIVSLTRTRPVAKHADQAGVLLGRAATSPDRAISVLSLSSSEECAREGDSDSCGHAQVRASGQPKWDAVGTGNRVSDHIREVDQRVDEIGQSVCVRQSSAGVRRPQAEDKRGGHGCGLRGDSSLNVEPEITCRSDAVRE